MGRSDECQGLSPPAIRFLIMATPPPPASADVPTRKAGPMSRSTSLIFYRPTEPPRVTGADLARFVAAFEALGAARAPEGFESLTVQLKFGAAVDQDDAATDWLVPVTDEAGIDDFDEIEWDATARGKSLAEGAATLEAAADRPLYRADIRLGPARDEVIRAVRREASADNDEELGLDSWSLEVGPILSHRLGADEMFHVGWIGLSLHGSGYLYPWSLADLVARAGADASIRAAADLCRRTWPVAPERPSPKIVRRRKKLGELWPYPQANLAWDWYWGMQESG